MTKEEIQKKLKELKQEQRRLFNSDKAYAIILGFILEFKISAYEECLKEKEE